MSSNGTKIAPPPRTIDVQKFAESRTSEFGSLCSIVATRLNNDLRSRRNKRRRTNAFDDRVARKRHRKRQKPVVADKSQDLSLDKDATKVSRYVRRRVEFKKNLESGYSMSGDGTRRLRTHVWHAKRFRMTKLWGYHLPLGLLGKGKGSKALLKKFKHGVLIHDASHYNVVQLEGPEDSLLSVLRTVMVPCPSAHFKDLDSSVLSGAIYGSAMLHYFGASASQPIAPVTYMWRPSSQQSSYVEADNQDSHGSSEQHNIIFPHFRRIWVWLHASVFSEGYNAFTLSCQKQMDEPGILIKCSSLEGQLARFELLGLKAFELIQKKLLPSPCILKNSLYLEKCSNQDMGIEFKKSVIVENKDNILSHSIISLTVSDPRSSTVKTNGIVSENISTVSGVKELWDIDNGISPPVEESVLCMERHHQHLDSFALDYGNSQIPNSFAKVQGSRACPVFLLKMSDQKGAFTGWSIILPLSWAKAFWIPFVTGGAHAIGLTEKHWVACEAGLPYFPVDFPDSNAYSRFMAIEAAVMDEKLKHRPPERRLFRIPIPPPWRSISSSFDRRIARAPFGEHASNLLTNPDSEKCDKRFEGFIPRQASMLICFLNQTDFTNLLLFPMQHEKEKTILNVMKNYSKFSQNLDGPTKSISVTKICFLRVLLRAVKKGVFEEGAVVCAPHFIDISLLISRSGDGEAGLEISQTSVHSYFEEQTLGEWDFRTPEDDPVSKESHRQPIGFVTTGFVQGSKKARASAICEAVLLSGVREEQWRNEVCVKRRKEEIYVLVRNLRSTAYRLALATIVLEQQEEDLEFL